MMIDILTVAITAGIDLIAIDTTDRDTMDMDTTIGGSITQLPPPKVAVIKAPGIFPVPGAPPLEIRGFLYFFFMTGNPAFFQAANPPLSAFTFV